MAIEQLKGGLLFPHMVKTRVAGTLSMTGFSINTSDFAATCFIAQKSGTLETVEFYGSGSATASFRVSVQARNATTGDPSGTNLVYRDISVPAGLGWRIPGKMTDNGTDGGNPLTLAKGDIYFVKIIATVSSGQANNISLATPKNLYTFADQGAGGLKGGAPLSLAIRYSDGAFYATSPFSVPAATILSSAINTGTTPDEVGTYFSFPADVLIGGMAAYVDLDGDAEFRIYDAEDPTLTPLRTVTLDKDMRDDTAAGDVFVMFADLLIQGNHRYIAAIRPTSATSLTPYGYTVNAAALLALQGGTDPWSWAARVDNGAFSETTTQRPFISVFVAGVDHEIGGQPSPGFAGDA